MTLTLQRSPPLEAYPIFCWRFGDSFGHGMVLSHIAWPFSWVVLLGSFLSTVGASMQTLTGIWSLICEYLTVLSVRWVISTQVLLTSRSVQIDLHLSWFSYGISFSHTSLLRFDMHFVLFSMWDGFFSPRVSESRPSRLREWDSETSGEKSISRGKPYKMHFLAYFTL